MIVLRLYIFKQLQTFWLKNEDYFDRCGKSFHTNYCYKNFATKSDNHYFYGIKDFDWWILKQPITNSQILDKRSWTIIERESSEKSAFIGKNRFQALFDRNAFFRTSFSRIGKLAHVQSIFRSSSGQIEKTLFFEFILKKSRKNTKI